MPSQALKAMELDAPISDYIPYSYHVSDTVVSTKRGEYLSVWRLAGRPHESASPSDVFRWLEDLNNVLRGMAALGRFGIQTTINRRRQFAYPDSQFDNYFCRALDEKYRASFTSVRTMVNELYVTIVLRPEDQVVGFLSRAEKQSASDRQARQDAAIETLTETNQMLGAALRKYGPELLSVYERDGRMYSQVLEFFGQIVNGEHMPMPILSKYRISEYLSQNRVLFAQHGELGEIRSVDSQRRFGMLEIAEYPDITGPGHLNQLLSSDFEFVLTQSFAMLTRAAGLSYLKKHQRHMADAKDAAIAQVQQLTVAMNDLMSGSFVMGEHHATLLVYGDTAQDVRDNLAQARSMMVDVAVLPKMVDLALEAGFWAQLPCNWEFRPRPAVITSLNFLSFSSFHNFHTGKAEGNPWGPAVTMFKTTSGTPLYFSFHASGIDEDATDKRTLGNTMVIGPSGGGKTVLLDFLIAQSQKFKPRVVVIDKDQGTEVAVRAMGGRYLPLKMGEPSGFNPFQLEPTPGNLIFLKQLVMELVSGVAKVTHQDEQEIDQAIQGMMTLVERKDRRLSTLMLTLPDPQVRDSDHPTVASRLRKWTVDGEFGWLFDNHEDALDLTSHQLYGFDVTEFLDNPEIRGPLMMYLIYRTEAMIDGSRFIYVFDEFWKVLQDKYFEDLARNKLKTIRKQNGIFVFATQEPSDALRSNIARTLVQQCATFVFLPNPKADEQEYREGFKLTESEFELIRSMGEGSRRFLVKQGEATAVAELDLGGFDEELMVLSGTPDNALRAQELIARHGEKPEAWLPHFYGREGGR